MRRDPRIERREWLFEQGQLLDSGLVCGRDRQLTGLFIEGRRYRQHDVVLIQPPFPSPSRVFVIPAVTDVREQARRRLDRRQPWSTLTAPGQERGGPIDAGIR
jgi:hypothetical protein